jgi:hypothetical protein
MNTFPFYPEDEREILTADDILSVFQTEEVKKSTITEDMTPKEIAEIISEELMKIVRQQFEEAGRKFEEHQQNK